MRWIKLSFLSMTFVLGSILLPQQGFSQLKTYEFDQVDSLQKEEPRDLVVFIHADWCKFCHIMRHTTLRDKTVMGLLNDGYYFVSLNAEDKQDIHFGGQTFKYVPSGVNTGVNELAEILGKNESGVLPCPSIVLVSTQNEILFQKGGYVSGEDLANILIRAKAMAARN